MAMQVSTGCRAPEYIGGLPRSATMTGRHPIRAPPTTQEMQQLVTDLARTIEAWLDTQGYGSDDPCDEERTRLTKKPRGRSRWHPWADLLWRVFAVDGLACAFGGRRVLHAIVQPPATLGVLDSLRRSANRNARAPPMAI